MPPTSANGSSSSSRARPVCGCRKPSNNRLALVCSSAATIQGICVFHATICPVQVPGLLKSHFQLSILACKHGRLRRPRRFFAVSAPFAFPKGRQKAQKLQKRIVQRLCLCTNATFEKPCPRAVNIGEYE